MQRVRLYLLSEYSEFFWSSWQAFLTSQGVEQDKIDAVLRIISGVGFKVGPNLNYGMIKMH